MEEEINFFIERVLHITDDDVKAVVRLRYFDFSAHQARMFATMTRFGRLTAMAEFVHRLFQIEVQTGYVAKHILGAIDPRCFHTYQGETLWNILEMYLYRRIRHLESGDTIDGSLDRYGSSDEDTASSSSSD